MPGYRRVDLRQSTFDAVTVRAEAMDLPTTNLIDAVLRGAIRTGQVDRLAQLALADQQVRRRQRTVVREWTLDPSLAGMSEGMAGVWTSGDWFLVRHGTDRAGSWFLYGPWAVAGVDLQQRRRPAACREADARIARILAETQPVRVSDGE